MPRGYKGYYTSGYGRRGRKAAAGLRRAGARIQQRRQRRTGWGPGWAGGALSLKQISNARIGGYLGIETKFYDQKLITSALTAPTDATGGEHDPSATVLLNTVVQGDGESNRDGRKITMKSIFVRGIVVSNARTNVTVPITASEVMIAIVLDTQTNGATLASENVFANPGANGITATSVFRNLQYTKRFKVLKRVCMTLPQSEMTYDGTNMEAEGFAVPFSMFVKLNDIRVLFSGTTETVASITDNSLHVVAYCTNVGQVPTLNYISRLRFVG